MLSASSSFQYRELKFRHKNAPGNAEDSLSTARSYNNLLFGILVSSPQTGRRISELCRKIGCCKIVKLQKGLEISTAGKRTAEIESRTMAEFTGC